MGDVIHAHFGSDRWRRETREHLLTAIDVVYGEQLQGVDRESLASVIEACLWAMIEVPPVSHRSEIAFPPFPESAAEVDAWKATVSARLDENGNALVRKAVVAAVTHCAQTFSTSLPKIMAAASLRRSPYAERILGRT